MLVCPPVFKTGRGWSRAVRMGSIPIHPRQKQASCGCTATGGLLFFAAFYRKAPYSLFRVQFLGEHGFHAKKTGSNDGGIDIIATSIARPIKYSLRFRTHVNR